MKIKIIFSWLCGIWAFGLGSRILFEMWDWGRLGYDTINIPIIPLNIFWDFVPLAMFGFITLVLSLRDMLKEMKK